MIPGLRRLRNTNVEILRPAWLSMAREEASACGQSWSGLFVQFFSHILSKSQLGGVIVAVFIFSHKLHKMYHSTFAFKKMKSSSTKMQLKLLEMPLAKF